MPLFDFFNFFQSSNQSANQISEMSDTTSIRLPVSMLEEIEAQRLEENRTKNLQITHLLKIGIDYNRSQLDFVRKLGHEHFLLLQRLHFVFNAIRNLQRNPTSFTLTYFAEKLGHPNVSKVDQWFSGKLMPEFADLEQIADLFNVSANFLKYGNTDFAPFEVLHSTVIEDPKRFVTYLLGLSSQKLKQIKLVRGDKGDGVAVCLLYGESHWKTVYFSNYRLRTRQDVGGGGMSNLESLAVICYVLCRNKSNVTVDGYSINDKLFEGLTTGKIHPAELFYYSPKHKCHWDQTIWNAQDLAGLLKDGTADSIFWPGATELFRDIQDRLKTGKHLERYQDSEELKEIEKLLFQWEV